MADTGKTQDNKSQANEGEGNQTQARAYNEDTRKYVEAGKVEKAAREAAKAVKGSEGEELRQAEAIGKQHSHGEDPLLKRKGE